MSEQTTYRLVPPSPDSPTVPTGLPTQRGKPVLCTIGGHLPNGHPHESTVTTEVMKQLFPDHTEMQEHPIPRGAFVVYPVQLDFVAIHTTYTAQQVTLQALAPFLAYQLIQPGYLLQTNSTQGFSPYALGLRNRQQRKINELLTSGGLDPERFWKPNLDGHCAWIPLVHQQSRQLEPLLSLLAMRLALDPIYKNIIFGELIKIFKESAFPKSAEALTSPERHAGIVPAVFFRAVQRFFYQNTSIPDPIFTLPRDQVLPELMNGASHLLLELWHADLNAILDTTSQTVRSSKMPESVLGRPTGPFPPDFEPSVLALPYIPSLITDYLGIIANLAQKHNKPVGVGTLRLAIGDLVHKCITRWRGSDLPPDEAQRVIQSYDAIPRALTTLEESLKPQSLILNQEQHREKARANQIQFLLRIVVGHNQAQISEETLKQLQQLAAKIATGELNLSNVLTALYPIHQKKSK